MKKQAVAGASTFEQLEHAAQAVTGKDLEFRQETHNAVTAADVRALREARRAD